MRALELRDERRVSFFMPDRFTNFLTTWTRPEWVLHRGHFEDRLAVYMGWEAPLTLEHAGVIFRNGSREQPLHPHGWNLECARMPGQDWRVQHDAIEQPIFEDTINSGIEGVRGPRRIFNQVIPPAQLNADLEIDERTGRPRRAQRLAIVPDARYWRRDGRRGDRGAGDEHDGALRSVLIDHKTLHYSTSTYTDAHLRAVSAARGQRRRRGRSAVEARAAQVNSDYIRHAQELDRTISGITVEQQREGGVRGPVEQRLRELGVVEGWVTGSFNEASPEIHTHLSLVATQISRNWRYLGCRSQKECRGKVSSFLYRKWGAAIANSNAALRVRRIESLGVRGQGARAWGNGGDPAGFIGGVAALDDLRVDVGGGHGPGFL